MLISRTAETSKIQNELQLKTEDATELKTCKRVYFYFVLHLVMIKSENEMMWTGGIQMKWTCDHRSSPKKKNFGASTGFAPVASALQYSTS